jgi:hypothetical protein
MIGLGVSTDARVGASGWGGLLPVPIQPSSPNANVEKAAVKKAMAKIRRMVGIEILLRLNVARVYDAKAVL